MIIELSQARQWRADLARHGENAALRARSKGLLDTLPTIRDETMAAKKCAFCGIEFIGRKDARFCSDVHRAAANRRKDERGPSELAEKLRSAAQADDLYVASIGSVDAGKHKRARNVALHEAHAAIVAELGQEQEPNASRTEVDEPVVTTVDVVDVVEEQDPNASRTEVQEPVVTTVDVVEEQEPNASRTEVDEPVVTTVDVVDVVEAQEPNASRTEVQEPVVTTVDVVEEQDPNASRTEVQEPVAPVVVAPVVVAPVELLTPEIVREKLRAFIAETSFGQGKIAKLAGVNQPMISMFLAGKKDGSPSFRQSILDVVDQDHGLDRR